MVTHQGWDCKDDMKLFKFDDSEVILSFLSWIKSCYEAKIKTKLFTVAGNHCYG